MGMPSRYTKRGVTRAATNNSHCYVTTSKDNDSKNFSYDPAESLYNEPVVRKFKFLKNVRFPKLLDKEWLDTQYNKDMRSVRDIANEVECSHQSVVDYLDYWGLNVRGRYVSRHEMNAKKLEIFLNKNPNFKDKNWVIENYSNKHLAVIDFAKINNISYKMAYKILRHHEIPVSKLRQRLFGSDGSSKILIPELLDRNWLNDKYWNEGLSLGEIGELLKMKGANPASVILRRMKQFDIPTRNVGPKNKGSSVVRTSWPKEIEDKEWLRQKYVVERLHITDIAKLVGVFDAYGLKKVRYKLIEFGFRDASPNVKIHSSNRINIWPKEVYDKEWLRHKYHDEKLSLSKMADLFPEIPRGRMNAKINREMKRLKIPLRENESFKFKFPKRQWPVEIFDFEWLSNKIKEKKSVMDIAKILKINDGHGRSKISSQLKNFNIQLENSGNKIWSRKKYVSPLKKAEKYL